MEEEYLTEEQYEDINDLDEEKETESGDEQEEAETVTLTKRELEALKARGDRIESLEQSLANLQNMTYAQTQQKQPKQQQNDFELEDDLSFVDPSVLNLLNKQDAKIKQLEALGGELFKKVNSFEDAGIEAHLDAVEGFTEAEKKEFYKYYSELGLNAVRDKKKGIKVAVDHVKANFMPYITRKEQKKMQEMEEKIREKQRKQFPVTAGRSKALTKSEQEETNAIYEDIYNGRLLFEAAGEFKT